MTSSLSSLIPPLGHERAADRLCRGKARIILVSPLQGTWPTEGAAFELWHHRGGRRLEGLDYTCSKIPMGPWAWAFIGPFFLRDIHHTRPSAALQMSYLGPASMTLICPSRRSAWIFILAWMWSQSKGFPGSGHICEEYQEFHQSLSLWLFLENNYITAKAMKCAEGHCLVNEGLQTILFQFLKIYFLHLQFIWNHVYSGQWCYKTLTWDFRESMVW